MSDLDSSSILNYPGQVNILQADIVSHLGTSVDVTALIQELSLYEDLFSNTMSGHILMEDALEIMSTLPMIGQEYFKIKLQTPSVQAIIEKKFYVYKMEKRTTKKKSQSYILDFCSLELISSINTRVSRAFDGKISDTVATLFRQPPEGDQRYIASPEILYRDPTKNSLSFISPYWTPLQTINWLCEKAINERGIANYLFYETNQAFEFMSLDSLIHSGTTREYIYGDVDSKTADLGNFETQYKTIDSMDTDITFDYLRSLSAGMYGSILYTFDTTSKTMSKSIYDYFEDSFGIITDPNKQVPPLPYHLEKHPINTVDLPRKRQASLHHIIKNNHVTGTNKPITYASFYQQRNSLVEQMHAFKFNIRVFGRTDVKVGDIIKFTMNEMRDITKAEIDTGGRSSYFSGRYLVTAIRHVIIQGMHHMTLEIASDSFIEKLK